MILKVIFALFLFSVTTITSANTITVTLLLPSQKYNPFFSLVEKNMTVAARQLNIDLNIINTPRQEGATFINRKRYLANFNKMITTLPKNSYLLAPITTTDVSLPILNKISQTNIKFISIINDLMNIPELHNKTRSSRFPNWLGQVVGDDYQAGSLLAQLLIDKTQATQKTPIEIVAISGTPDNTAVQLRDEGLFHITQNNNKVELKQIAHTNWYKQRVIEVTRGLMKRNPNTSVIWCANDDVIASNVIEQLQQLSYKPNKNIFVGGIDWSKRGLKLYKQGLLSESLGGHVFTGALALVLLYDYHNGLDFISQHATGNVKLKLTPLTNNLENVERIITGDGWRQLDYRIYSRHLNPEQKVWDLNFQRLLDGLAK